MNCVDYSDVYANPINHYFAAKMDSLTGSPSLVKASTIAGFVLIYHNKRVPVTKVFSLGNDHEIQQV